MSALRVFCILLLGALGNLCLAAEVIHPFDDPDQRERFQYFTENLRCPMCDNQNLEGSNSEISADLRNELARMIRGGKTDQEITQFMQERYGDFVFYKPPVNRATIWLWALPAVLALVALIAILRLVRNQRRGPGHDISATERAEAQRLLAQQEIE